MWTCHIVLDRGLEQPGIFLCIDWFFTIVLCINRFILKLVYTNTCKTLQIESSIFNLQGFLKIKSSAKVEIPVALPLKRIMQKTFYMLLPAFVLVLLLEFANSFFPFFSISTELVDLKTLAAAIFTDILADSLAHLSTLVN